MARCLALLLVVGCGSGGPSAPAVPVVEAKPVVAVTPPDLVALNQRAADATLGRPERCAAVFELFDKHIPAGTPAPAAAAVLTDRSWITVDDPVKVLGGWVPVEINQVDSVFVVHCVAARRADLNNQLWSDWVIYGRISGTNVESLKPFLATGPDVRLIEYALVYPDGRIEQYRPQGRNTMKLPR